MRKGKLLVIIFSSFYLSACTSNAAVEIVQKEREDYVPGTKILWGLDKQEELVLQYCAEIKRLSIKQDDKFDILFEVSGNSLKYKVPDNLKVSNVSFQDNKIQTWCTPPQKTKNVAKEEIDNLLNEIKEVHPIKVSVIKDGSLLEQTDIQIVYEENIYE
ncbi:hypothetical protein [Mesobacillus selenatarsenatis]|uniref:Lipoprotein n=1 Tax=Mesobacillus selenatarsenatis TaxID=388741 RepID=A0A846TNY6_9BACI|nr:hypothetical protein [Mesobacillus selenatarsenatis]NKE07614.1 hypothetical protein [Mesobacillus selenatarsenatis]